MNTSGEAAEQVMRMSLEGAEILIKLTGSGAKNAAVLLYSIYKEQNKTRGKERLTNMLRSGKPLKVYTFKRDNLEKFKEVAKEYGILYTVLKEKEDKDGVFDVLVRADDDSKLASPPYYGLRDYGVDGQIGTEESPQAYICRLVEVFREVRRVLTDDGTLWLNIADSYAGSGKGIWKGATEKTDCKNNYRADTTAAIHGMPVVWDGIKAKDMIGIPWMLAFALRADGWYLRSDIIWNKTNGLPENVKDRPTKSYEHIFLLTKSPRYYYDAEAIAQPLQPCSIARYERGRSDHTKYKGFNGNQSINEKRERGQECKKLTRNKRDVWNLSTNSYRMDGHFAMFPERLVEPCILAGCPVGGVVLDPFLGSGTTGAVAKRLGRQYIGIDLNPAYCRAAEDRIREIPDSGARELTEERKNDGN